MEKILVLWATPRSTSTAFEWMMRERGDMLCFHEPFGEVWYQGEAPLWPRAGEDSVRTPGLTYERVWATLRDAATRGLVFSKEFPHVVHHISTNEFLDHFNHSFLIRDPAKTLTSMHKEWPEYVLEETGFAEQRALFDRLTKRNGEPPPLLDSDDLLADPPKMVEAWCNAVGIPFIESALSWAPGPREEVSWWDGGSFHANLRNSDGLKAHPRREADLADAPGWLKTFYALCLPHYEHMWRFRLGS